jgi:putative PEP-CTERM system histidine kinase
LNFLLLTSFLASAACFLLAAAALIIKRRSLPWAFFGLGMIAVGLDVLLGGLSLRADSLPQLVALQTWKLIVASFAPGLWLAFSLCYSRANYREFLKQWRYVLALFALLPLVAIFGFGDHLVGIVRDPTKETGYPVLGFIGKATSLGILAGSILILVNLERTFRSAVGIMRWRIKYAVFGAGLLFSAKIYTSSQALLYSSIHSWSVEINSIAVLIAVALIIYSFVRTRFVESEIYPSHKVLQQSLTVTIAGAYLVCVGIFANVVARVGGDPGFPIKAFFLMAILVGLAVVVLSDRVQQRIKVIVTRHFRRPVHDYRKVWSAFTERTGSLIDQTEFCRAAVKVVSDTFEVLAVTIWLGDDARRNLFFGASTSFTEEKAESILRELNTERLLQSASNWNGTIEIEKSKDGEVALLSALIPDYFHKGGSRLCVPLTCGGEFVGLLTVSDRVSGRGFSMEDIDLLSCIANQIAGSLRNIQLSRSQIENKQIQAFQAMSAFFVHDLKNTASTLSLMLQNLTNHFGNPEFREDCLRSLSRSVNHINDLIKRLALLRQELGLKKTDTDLVDLINNTLNDLGPANGASFIKDFQPVPRVAADPEQLRKVITNLLVNAREAINGHGEIRVGTVCKDSWVTLYVSDNGCGMSKEFMNQSLFRPFQTTKKSGLGIGMFHTRTIVEAHRGKIEVQSEPGKGTTFRVLLPR